MRGKEIKMVDSIMVNKAKWTQNKKVVCFLAVEGILLLLLFANLFGKNDIIEVKLNPVSAGTWTFREELGGWYADEQSGAGDLIFGNISLRAGTYKVCLQYETDSFLGNMCTIYDDTLSYGALLTNETHLFAGKDNTDYKIWLKENTNEGMVRISYAGKGYVLIKGLTIYETNDAARIFLFMVAACCVCLNAVLWYREKTSKAGGISAENKKVCLILSITVILASLPLMTNYVVGGGDIIFHLMRIEGIKDGLLSGQFPVRIAPEWLYGHGYATSVFYGDTFLYIPAIFRMIGFTVQDSYKLFLFILNLATALIAYECFRRIFSDRYLGVFCSSIYTLSIYRIFTLYCRAGLGSVIAMLFLPLLVYGFYRVYTEDVADKKYKKAWIPLAAGYCGLIQSHLLSCELFGGVSIVLCLLLWKKTFRRQTFMVLFKSVFLSCMISLWFLVPFLDYMITGDFVIHHVSARTIQFRGVYLGHLLFTFFRRGSNVFYPETGMIETEPAGVGITLMASLVFFLALIWLMPGEKRKEKYVRMGLIASLTAVCAMVFSMHTFPWDALQRMNRVFASLISSLQFPDRFLIVATIALVVVAGAAGKLIWQKGQLWKICFVGASVLLMSVSSIYLINDILYKSQFFRLYNEESMTYGYISGAEYLPTGTDTEQLIYKGPSGSERVSIERWEKKYLHVTLYCQNNGGEEEYVEMPMIYYKGYQAYGENSGFTVCKGANNSVRVMLPAGYIGKVEVNFYSPWYWRMAELFSIVAFCGCIGVEIYRKNRKEKKHAQNSDYHGKRGQQEDSGEKHPAVSGEADPGLLH